MNSNDIVMRTCPNCGTEYPASARRLKHGRQTTCSRDCSYALRAKERQKKIRCICASCEKVLWRSPSQIAQAKHGIFCSRPCHYAGRSTGATKRIVTKPYQYTEEGKAAQQIALHNPHRNKRKGRERLLICLNCKQEFPVLAWQRRNRREYVFCSQDCCNAYRTGEHNPAWRGGYPGYYGPDWRALRRAARIRDNYFCRRCGKDMHKPSRAPDVHHVTPVSSFQHRNDANTLDNVVCLCHSCHMQVEWHGVDFAL